MVHFKKVKKTLKITQGLGVPTCPINDKKVEKLNRLCLLIDELPLEVAEKIGISYSSCKAIFTNILDMK